MKESSTNIHFTPESVQSFVNQIKAYVKTLYDEKTFHEVIHNGFDIIKADNKELFQKVNKAAGIYLIWQIDNGQSPFIKYIGQSGSNCGFRLYNHLVKKGKNVGSVISRVKEVLQAGHKVGVTYISVSHKELIPFVEKIIIQTVNEIQFTVQLWNVHN